ncbi:MAG: sulfur oxidation c-type cytochrome SoxX [Hydrogenovibrio sp.]|nr:sulfur oxidation c-type cytochrome SoxX [Hydrogenovibrio sp.]
MLKTKMKQLLTALAISSAVAVAPVSVQAADKGMSDIEAGKKLAFSRSKGNCLACHAIQGGQLAGTIGPALIAMKLRYPDKQKLFDKVWGKPGTQIPNSMMPPFGQNGILTDKEINQIVDFIYTL